MARFRPRRRSSSPVSTRRQNRLRRFRSLFPRFSPLARLRGMDVLGFFGGVRRRKRLNTTYGLPSLGRRFSLVEALEPRQMLAADVQFDLSSYSAAEDETPDFPVVIIDGTVNAASTISFSTGGSASTPQDYTLAGTISVQPGTYDMVPVTLDGSDPGVAGIANTATLTIVNDNEVEGTEQIGIDINVSGDLNEGAQNTTLYTITDDDDTVFVDATDFANAPGNDLTVRVLAGQLQVVQTNSGLVIESHNPAAVNHIDADGGITNDTLRIENAVLHEGISVDFNGGSEQEEGGDDLHFDASGFGSVRYQFAETDNGLAPFAGTISLNGNQLISFSDLEPITQTGTVTSIRFDLTTGDDQALLEDNLDGTLTLSSTNGSFETVTFAAPDSRIDIRSLGGDDVIRVHESVLSSSRSFQGPGSQELEIRTDGGSDEIVLEDGGTGTNGLDLELIGGGAGTDNLRVDDGLGGHDILDINSGSIVTIRNMTIDDTADDFDDPLIRIQDAGSTLRLTGATLLADDDDEHADAALDPDPTMIEVNPGEPDVDLELNGGAANTFHFVNVPHDPDDAVVFVRNNVGSPVLGTDLEENNLIVTADEDTPLMIHLQSDYREVTGASADDGTVAISSGSKLVYTTLPHFEGAQDEIDFTLEDGGDASDNPNADGTILVNINAVNDAPVNSLPGTFTTTEEQSITISSNLLGVTDFDAGNAIIKVTLSVDNGTLHVNNFAAPGVVVTDNGTDSVMLEGTLSDINLILQDDVDTDGDGPDGVGVRYTPGQQDLGADPPEFGFNGTDTLTMTTNDNGATGAGGPKEDTDTADIIVSAVNDAPINELNNDSINDQVVSDDPPIIATVDEDSTDNPLPGLTVEDDAEENNGNITVELTVTDGMIEVDDDASGGVSSGNISGIGSSNITMTGTVDQVDATLATLTYTPTANFNGTAELTIETNDNGHHGSGGSMTDTDVVRIIVGGENDPPVNLWNGESFQDLADPTPNVSVDEDEVLAITQLSVSDIDAGSGDLLVTLSVNNGTLQVDDSVSGGISAGDISGNGSGSLTLQGTISELNATLATLEYQGNLNFNGSDTLTIETDDQGNSGSGTNEVDTDFVDITVNAVNDAPVITVGGQQNPGSQSVNEDSLGGPLVFDNAPDNNFNRILITDVDGNNLEVTLSVDHGTLTLAQPNNVTILNGVDGIDDQTIVFTGTQGQVNQALHGGNLNDGLTYNPDPNYFGQDTLSITANDLGNTGAGGPQEDMVDVDISVVPVNDTPVNTFGGTDFQQLGDPAGSEPIPTVTVDENTSTDPSDFTFSGSTQLSTTDIDAGDGEMKFTIEVDHGTVDLASTAGLTDVTGDGTSTVMGFGSLAEIQNALNNLVYTPDLNFNGNDTLTLTVDDQGNFGIDPGISGGASSEVDVDMVNIVVSSVNDPPSFNLAGGVITVMEDGGDYPNDHDETYTLNDFINNITPGPMEHPGQTVSLEITTVSSPPDLFTVAPQVVSGSFDDSMDNTTADVEFTVAANAFGVATVTVVATDSEGLSSAPQTFLIVVQPKNDNPQIEFGLGADGEGDPIGLTTDPDPLSIDEDEMVVFSAASHNQIVISDDSGDANSPQPITARFRVQFGELEILSEDDISVSGQGSSTLTITGTVDAIQDALDVGLKYTPNDHHNATRDTGGPQQEVSGADPDGATTTVGPFDDFDPFDPNATPDAGDRLTVEVNDHGHEGGQDRNPFSGDDPWDARRVLEIAIEPVNDAPTQHTDFLPVSLEENGPTHVIQLGTNGVEDGMPFNLLGTNFFDDADKFDEFPDNLTITVMNDNPDLVRVEVVGSTIEIEPEPFANSEDLGLANVKVVATDLHGEMVMDTFTVNVGAVNSAPVVDGNDFTTPEDTPATFDATVSDGDLEDDVLTVTIDSGNGGGAPLNGTITLSTTAGLTFIAGDGTDDKVMTFMGTQAAINAALNDAIYTPDEDFFGEDFIEITAIDSVPQAGSTVIEATVTSVNDPPVAADDQFFGIMEDSSDNDLDVLANDEPGPANESDQDLTIVGVRDAFSGIVSFIATTQFGGTVELAPDGQSVLYTPRDDFFGTDTFQYLIEDDGSPAETSVFGTVEIQVTAKNDQVELDAESSATTLEDTPLNLASDLGIVVRDDDPLGTSTTAPGVPGPSAKSSSIVELELTAQNGTFDIDVEGGVTVNPIADGVRLTGTVADINDTLAQSDYVPDADFNDNLGSETITVFVDDLGNIGTGQPNTTDSATIDVDITPVNDQPMITFAQDPVRVQQNSGMTTISGFVTDRMPDAQDPQGPGADEAGQEVTYQITSTDDPEGILVGSVQLNNDGADADKLIFEVNDGKVGIVTVEVTVMDDGGTDNGGIDTKVQSFQIQVGVNKEPIFTLDGNHPAPMNPQGDIQVNEGSGLNIITDWLETLYAGPFDDFPTDQDIQSVAISDPLPGSTLGIDDFFLYPTISDLTLPTPGADPGGPGGVPAPEGTSGSGDLRFQALNNVSGVLNLRITVVDDGGTIHPADDNTATRDFKIEIAGVNNPPSFDIQDSHTSNEDAGLQNVPGFAFNIDPGLGEGGQTVHFNVINNSDPSLFSTQPSLTSAGTLVYQAAPDANGVALITVEAQDDGGGDDTSGPQTFAIQVNAVNDAPSAMFSVDPVEQDQTSTPTLQFIVDHLMFGPGGGADEVGQDVQITDVSSDNSSLFSVQPTYADTGTDGKATLVFQAAPNAAGTANVTVTLVDDGGTANGGENTRLATFQIVINSTADAVVEGRHIFYKNSSYDPSLNVLNALDGSAIDFDKDALLPNETATFANTTGYHRGINGIMIDVTDLANPNAAALADDLSFRTGNSNDTSTWTPLNPALVEGIFVHALDADTHRITIGFVDGAITDTWLEVRLDASSDTGLAGQEVHYWGNVAGNAGHDTFAGVADVAAGDLQGIAQNIDPFPNSLVNNPYDLNKDRKVDGGDLQVIAQNVNPFALFYITPNGALGSAGAAAIDTSAGDESGTEGDGELGGDVFSGGSTTTEDGRVGETSEDSSIDDAFASLDEEGGSMDDDLLDLLADDLAGDDLLS